MADMTELEARVAEARDWAYTSGIDADKSPKYLAAYEAAVRAHERALTVKRCEWIVAGFMYPVDDDAEVQSSNSTVRGILSGLARVGEAL